MTSSQLASGTCLPAAIDRARYQSRLASSSVSTGQPSAAPLPGCYLPSGDG